MLIGCTNTTNNSRFSKEEIASLQLDEAKPMKVNTDSITYINLNPILENDVCDIEQYIDEISLIPLETNESSLLDDIYKILFTKEHIYIHDKYKGGGIVIFDNLGNFKTRITNGPGPHELQRLYDIAYDFENNQLIAYKHSYLMYFTPNGEFIGQTKLPLGFYNFAKTPNGYIFKTIGESGNNHLKEFKRYRLYICDNKFKMKKGYMYSAREDDPLIGKNYILKNHDYYKISEAYNDTIYSYSNIEDSIRAEYVIDYSDKKISNKKLSNESKFFEEISSRNVFYFLGKYFENETHQAFVLNNSFRKRNTIIFRDKENGHILGGSILARNRTQSPTITPISSTESDFISLHYYTEDDTVLQRSSIITEQDKLKLSKVTEDDNPIIVKYKLKHLNNEK